MALRYATIAVFLAAALLSSCDNGADEVVDVAVIGSPETMFAKGLRLSDAGQYLRASTADGLVGFDADGQVVPGLAERWIITDAGRSYLFRISERNWPDGSPLTSQTVTDSLRRTLKDLRGTSLGLDLARILDVRAMAGRVVEIRLITPMPQFLQLLAQPELGLFRKGRANGVMTLRRQDGVAILSPVRPDQRGLPSEPGWDMRARQLRLTALSAGKAVERFSSGEMDVVLGGQIENLPLAATGPLSRRTVMLDGVQGLLGLEVVAPRGFLENPSRREAIAMVLDRDALIAPFNIDGWVATTRVVPPGLPGDLGTIGERWSGLSMDERRRQAGRRVAAWRKASGARDVELSIDLPAGPGATMILARLRADLAAIGIQVVRKADGQPADLVWVDRVARIADARWFLNQFHCSLRQGPCSPAADARVAESLRAPDEAASAALLAEAEAELTASNVFIPIGAPVRWSMVRSDVTGFAQNRLGFHPLLPLAIRPK